jgi:hypothetical protein
MINKIFPAVHITGKAPHAVIDDADVRLKNVDQIIQGF